MEKYKIVLYVLSIVLMVGCHKSENIAKDAIDGFVYSEPTLPKIITKEQLDDKSVEFNNMLKNKMSINQKAFENLKKILLINDKLGTKKLEWGMVEMDGEKYSFRKSSEKNLQKIIQILKNDSNHSLQSTVLNCTLSTNDGWSIDEIKKVLYEFEMIGYSNLTKHFIELEQLEGKSHYGQGENLFDLVRNNLSFYFFRANFGISVTISLQLGQIFFPETFESFITENIIDGFYPIQINTRGRLERILLQGSASELETAYCKSIHLYFNQGKLIQMDIYFESNTNKKNLKSKIDKNQLFSSTELPTVEKLFGHLIKDTSQIIKFLNNLSFEGEQQGKIENRTWKLDSYKNGVNEYKKVSVY